MKCPKCKKEFKNYAGLATHLAKSHDIKKEDSYILIHLDGQVPVCSYEGCQKKPAFRGASRGYQKYCSVHRGKWQEGLTAENDERIKVRGKAISAAQISGKHWSADNELKNLVSDKISYSRSLSSIPKQQTLYDNLSKGYGWSAGLNKNTDPRIASMGDAVKKSIAEKGCWSKGLTKETDFRIAKMSQGHLLSSSAILERIASNKNFSLVSDIESYSGYQIHLDVQCKKCKLVQKKTLKSLDEGSRCYACFPYGFTSKYEDEIREYVRSIGFNCLSSRQVIPPYEIDIYVPEQKFGIELNGLYWHSEKGGASKNQHQQKSDLCFSQGIKLFHVFEDEWRDKQEIIKSMISHSLGVTKNRIYARSCNVVFDLHGVDEFIEKSHLDGSTKFKKSISLIFNGKIVASMTLRKPFMSNPETLEVARFCCALDTSIIGALSRLLKYAVSISKEMGYKKLITYADQRLGQINSYEKAGFIKDGETPIRFWWSDFNTRFNRFKFRATNSMTEKEVAKSYNVSKIWACKNLKYTLKLN